jgi:acyl carrier protein
MCSKDNSKKRKVIKIIKDIRSKKNLERVENLDGKLKLTEDLGLNSFDLAELTVKIEDEFGVDIFEDEGAENVRQIMKKINNG